MVNIDFAEPADQPVPTVYINGYDMANLAYFGMDVISGLKIKFGGENTNDMFGPDSCSAQLMIREPNDMSFLHIGAVLAVNSHTLADNIEYTQFVGRVAVMDVEYSSTHAGALIVTLSATGLLADIANTTAYDVSAASVPGSTKINDLGYYIGNGWGIALAQSNVRWGSQMHAAVRYKSKPVLEMTDQYLRAQNMIRTDCSYFDPAISSSPVKQLMFHELLNRRVIIHDGLRANVDGTWVPNPFAPKPVAPDLIQGSPFYSVFEADAGMFREETQWSMNPDDLITDLNMQRIDPLNPDDDEDAKRTPVSSKTYWDNTDNIDKLGVRAKDVDTDLPAGVPVDANQREIMYSHLYTIPGWRLRKLRFADTRMLGDWFSSFTATHRRYSILLALQGFRDNVPGRGYTVQRGMVCGGEMTYNSGDKIKGKVGRWDLTVNLSDYQVAQELDPTTGSWSFTTIAGLPVPAISDATAATVGDRITFADFERIG